MSWIALGLVVLLVPIAALHAVWGLGATWPARDEASLSRAVTGFKAANRMPPPFASILVALLLLGVAGCAVLLDRLDAGTPMLPAALVVSAGCGCALVFFCRGMAAYLPAWRRLTPREPFATLDRAVYGPLCLVFGSGFGLLVFRWITLT